MLFTRDLEDTCPSSNWSLSQPGDFYVSAAHSGNDRFISTLINRSFLARAFDLILSRGVKLSHHGDRGGMV